MLVRAAEAEVLRSDPSSVITLCSSSWPGKDADILAAEILATEVRFDNRYADSSAMLVALSVS